MGGAGGLGGRVRAGGVALWFGGWISIIYDFVVFNNQRRVTDIFSPGQRWILFLVV